MEYFDLVEQECPAPAGSAAFDFSSSGALTGRFTFDSRLTTTGQTCTYTAKDASGNVETGLGTWNETAKTLARTTIYSSSNGGAAESFSGTVTVAMDWLSDDAKNAYVTARRHIHFESSRYVTYVSPTSIKINGGGQVIVNSELLEWSSDITWSGTSGVAPLAADGVVYGYLYSNSGTPALEVSTTAPEWDSANRYWRKTSDSTRRCVWAGYVWATTTPTYRIVPFTAVWRGDDAEIFFDTEYVDASNQYKLVGGMTMVLGGAATTATSFTISNIATHASHWWCSAKIVSGAVNTDGILGISDKSWTSSGNVGSFCSRYTVRAYNPGSSSKTFFGRTWIPISTANTAYYAVQTNAGTPTAEIESAGQRIPL